MDLKEINVLVLAYLGDAIYEYYVRNYLIDKKIANVKVTLKRWPKENNPAGSRPFSSKNHS